MRGAVVGVLLLAVGATGAAGPAIPLGQGVRAVVERPADTLEPLVLPISGESPYIYLNRCVGGCLVTGGATNDARNFESNIPTPGQYLIGEFADENGDIGSAADPEWNELVQCMKEVYSPYAVTITDQEPSGVTFTEALVAGVPSDIGRPADNLGVATISSNCSPVDDTLAFVFANVHPGSGMDRVYQICWTASQESAHAFGLDHEYQFTDGESACRDPMTYRTDCGGEKFFRDLRADCGETAVRACRCSATQNSSAILTSVFGPGTPITAPPQVDITVPANGGVIGTVVHASASAVRGVAKVELFINGSRWSYAYSKVAFGGDGQPASDYVLTVPAGIPKGTLDLDVRASDDLGVAADSTITVSNGPPCTSNGQCLADQTCTAGLCAYPPPALQLGDSCSYDQQCTTWECTQFSDGKTCTTECEVDEPTSCPATFSCIDAGDGHGRCVIESGGGCCEAGRSGSPWAPAALTAAILGLVLRRRRAR